MIKVHIVDDDLFVRSALAELLPARGDIVVTGAYGDGASAVAAADADPPDVILMDVAMPVMDGITATRMIRDRQPQVRVLGITSLSDEANVARMRQAGAIGFLFKDAPPAAMARAIEAAHQGLAVLSEAAVGALATEVAEPLPALGETEREILELVCAGLTNAEIAARVYLSPSTVKHHISALMTTFGVTNRTMLASRAKAGR